VTTPNDPRALCESLRHQAIAAAEENRFDDARSLFEEARELASVAGFDELGDRIRCNLSLVETRLGQRSPALTELREVLTRRSGELAFLAAYNLSLAYETFKEHRKGLFYARVARDVAVAEENSQWMAGALNRIGNSQLALSFLEEAEEAYLSALRLVSDNDHQILPFIRQNFGYLLVLQGRAEEGRGLLVRSLRALRRQGRAHALIHLDLCFAYLELDRPQPALRHGLRALELAREEIDPTHLKNALYLTGEAAHLCGDVARSRHSFDQLERLYPDTAGLTDILLSVGVRQLVNLRA
jgi:tetratricopeptide (TPR) repeat protein